MNKKALVFLIVCVAGAALLQAKVTVSKIEYLPGEDFVQLFLRTDRIMPIPDIFHPEKDKRQSLVMRMRDVDFALDKDSLAFDSPVIQDVSIRDGGSYTDVEIRLKAEVDYRIFTNQNGLFIEFPMVRELARHASPAAPVNAAPAPARAEPKPVPAAKPAAAPVHAPAAPPAAIAPAAAPPSGVPALSDLRLLGSRGDRVSFELLFNRLPEFAVIPIDQQPARLAIDLKSTQARKLRQDVNAGNVRGVRGAYNAPEVYRVVFDLTHLAHYAVTADGNRLLVEFFETPPVATPPPATADNRVPVAASQPEATPPAAPQPVSTPPAAPPDSLKLALQAAARAETPAVNEVLPTAVKVQPAATQKEFFGAEKSRSDYITAQDEKGNEQTAFVRQTVAEGKPKYGGEPMDFSFKNAELVNVLKFIAKVAGLNLMIDPNVSGRITCELVQVPWDQALEMFLKINKLDMVQEGNILRVGNVDALAEEAKKRQALREAKEQEGPLEVITRTLSFAKVKDVIPTLKKMMTPRGDLTPDERTNTLIIQEVPEKIKVIDALIDTLDAANPQVSIEARIVEATVNSLDTFGIQWGYSLIADSATGNQTSLKFPSTLLGGGMDQKVNNYQVNQVDYGYAINLPATSSAIFPFMRFGNIANTFNIDLQLSALARKGKARVISAPKTTTQNNKPAEIEQGARIPYETNQNNTITTQYITAALGLKVTPQITARGSVIMDLEIKNDQADWQFRSQNGNPQVNTETVKTSVMVNDGATLVIGGLYRVEQTDNSDGVPVLSRIPILGSLFRNRSRVSNQKELVVFITPRIIK